MLRRTFLFGAAAALTAQETRKSAGDLGSLAYIGGGTLWVRPLPDGEPRAVAAGRMLYAPRFSASGRWILFRDGDDLARIVSADGSQSSSWPERAEWMPQSDLLLVGGNRIFSEEEDWRTTRHIYADPVGKLSRDGKRHAWVVSPDGGPAHLFTGPFDSSGERQLLGESKEGGFEIFSFLRDGRRFLYWWTDEDGANVWGYGMNLQIGGGPRRIDTGICTIPRGNFDVDEMSALSPAADVLAAAVGGDHLMYQEHMLVVADLSGDGKPKVSQITGPAVNVLNPAWSPDGTRLAWSQGPDARETAEFTEDTPKRCLMGRRLWAAGKGGLGKPAQITDDARYGDQNPVWSRDGRHILFTRTGADGVDAVWLIRADGSGAREVARPLESDALFSGLPLFDWSMTRHE